MKKQLLLLVFPLQIGSKIRSCIVEDCKWVDLLSGKAYLKISGRGRVYHQWGYPVNGKRRRRKKEEEQFGQNSTRVPWLKFLDNQEPTLRCSVHCTTLYPHHYPVPPPLPCIPATSLPLPPVATQLPPHYPGGHTLHCTALYCTALHCTLLHCTALHSSLPHCTVVQARQV